MEPNPMPKERRAEERRLARTSDETSAERGDRTHPASVNDLRGAAQDAFEAVELLSRQLEGFVMRQAADRPEVLLACAALLGFVLGGGLASRTGSLLVRIGSGLVMAHFLRREPGEGWFALHPPAAKNTSLE